MKHNGSNQITNGGSPITQPSFRDFVFKNKGAKPLLWACAALMLLQFIIFKYFYPQAGFIHGDSFNYLNSAYQNLDINTYMIGYAKFLRLFSVFTSADLPLVAFQYLLIQGGGLFLVFSLFFFYHPGRIVQWLMLACIVINPLFLYMANYISSDGLFLALSLVWFALLLWIIHQPSRRIIIWQGIIMFLAFTVRYNALIYPALAIMAFSISPLSLRRKIYGAGLGVGLMTVFILFTGFKYKTLTGTWQYSPFSGWMLANNAMYTYRYVDSADRKRVPTKLKALDDSVRRYFDTHRNVKRYPEEALEASTVYMWDPRTSPLYKYRESLYKKDSVTSELKKWATMGPLYKEYGTWIIMHYPWQYLRHFIWPNAQKYYAPPVEFLAAYNSGKDSTALIGKIWFKYKSGKLFTRVKDKKVHMLDYYPILSGITNIVMFFILLFFIGLKGTGSTPAYRKGVLLGAALWLINAGFTIFASSAALRFQAFPVILSFVFMLLLVDWLAKVAFAKQPTTIKESSPVIIETHEEALTP